MGKILLIDDEESIREVVSRHLKKKGHDVIIADSAEMAEMIIKTNPADLIITDISMGGMSGIDFLKKLRTVHGKDTPVIIITGYPEKETILEAREHGVTQYILKPLKFNRLTEAVNNLIGPASPEPSAQTGQTSAQAGSGAKIEEFPSVKAVLLRDNSGGMDNLTTLLYEMKVQFEDTDDWRKAANMLQTEKPHVFFVSDKASEIDVRALARGIKKRSSSLLFVIIEHSGNGRITEGVDVVLGADEVSAITVSSALKLASKYVSAPKQKPAPAGRAVKSPEETLSPTKTPVKPTTQHTPQDDSGSPKRLISEKRLEKAFKEVREVRALPFVASELTKLVHMPHVDFHEVAECMKKDQGLTAKILKLSNSAFFKREKRIYDIEGAVRVIGLKEIHTIALGITIVELLKGRSSKGGFNRLKFWEHSIGVAAFADTIAKELGWENTEDAFIAGLLHDLGKALFDDCFHKEYEEMLRTLYFTKRPGHEIEKEMLGVTHTEFAKALSVVWRLPKYVIPPMAGHHMEWKDLEKKIASGEQYTPVIKMADSLAIATREGWTGNGIFAEVPDFITSKLGLRAGNVENIMNNVGERIEELKNILLLYHGEIGMDSSGDAAAPDATGKNVLFVRRQMPIVCTPVIAMTNAGANVTKKFSLDLPDLEGDYDVVFFRPESAQQAASVATTLQEEFVSQGRKLPRFVFLLSDYLASNLPPEVASLSGVTRIAPPFALADFEDALA